MRYNGLLYVAMITLILLVLIKNGSLFYDPFFGAMYIITGLILVAGTRFVENFKVDLIMGSLILFIVTIFTVYVIFSMMTFSPYTVFEVILLVFLDLCGLAFLNEAKRIKKEELQPQKEKVFEGWKRR